MEIIKMEVELKPGLFCAMVAVMAYVNTFHAGFVYDDNRAILQNPDVVQSSSVAEIFTNDFWGTPLNHSGSHRSYRPITVLSFRLNHHLFGLQPASYHVVNVIFHASVTFLLCFATSYLLQFTKRKSFCVGILFAVHPIHTEAVAGIVGRADILATLFFLSTLLTYARACDHIDRRAADRRRRSENPLLLVADKIQTLSYRANDRKSKRKRKSRCGGKNSNRTVSNTNPSWERGAKRNRKLVLPKCDGFADRSGDSDDSHTTADTVDSVSSAASVADDSTTTGGNATTSGVEKMSGLDSRTDKTESKPVFQTVEHSAHASPEQLSWPAETANLGSRNDRTWMELSLIGLSFSSATASVLCKEQGYCALPICIIYDVCIRNGLGLRGIRSLLLGKGRNLSHVRWRVFSTMAFAIFMVSARLLLPMLLSTRARFAPDFSASDNPASSCSDSVTRFLTFNYLLFFNFFLFLYPARLSFDWSMDAIPLVESVWDIRNFGTFAFYALLAFLARCSWRCFVLNDKRQLSAFGREAFGERVVEGGRRRGSSSSSESDSLTSNASTANKSITDLRSGREMDLWVKECPELKRARTLLLGTVVAALAFLPASNLFFYVGFVVAERVLYLPSAGACICAVEVLSSLLDSRSDDTSNRCRKRPASHHASSKTISLFTSAMFVLILCMATRTWNRNRDWESEMTLYRSGVATNPAKALGNLGNVYRAQGRLRDAETAYLEALKRRSNMADVHYNLGLLYQDQKRFIEAESSYLKAIHFRPKLALAHLNLGVVLAEQGRLDEAKKVYRKTSLIDDNGVRDPRAHARAQVSALYNLGCLLADESHHAEAIASFREAVARRPFGHKPHSLYNMLGQSLHQVGSVVEAERWFQSSLAAKPDHVPAHLTYARLLSDVGRVGEAERFYSDAIRIEPESSVVYRHYSNFLTAQGRLSEAAQVMDSSVSAASGTPDYDALLAAAGAHRHAKSYDKAELYYRRAVLLKPDFASAHMNLGAILHLRSRYAEAEASYRKALSLKPADPLIEENLAKLRRAARENEEP